MDRKVVYAILLMLAVMLVPALLFRRPEARPTAGTDTTQAAGRVVDSAARATPTLTPAPAAVPTQDTARIAEDTVTVSGPLYRYAFSTRGGRLIEATLLKYQSMRP